MKSLSVLALSVALCALVHAATAAEVPPDYRFQVERLVEGIPQPMGLALAPDGRIFFNEYAGKLKIYHPKTRAVVVAGELKVFKEQENGFLGFALDPKFAENGWIYCLYSPPGFDGQNLSRFTMKGDTLDLASEKLLLQYDEQRKQCCHHGATLAFAPDGCLLWSAGDNTHPHADSNGYGPLDERPDRAPWDAQKSAANTMSLAGKICRIRPKPDGTYEIPSGNLFPPGTPKTRPEIYAMGCRNPWRMSVDAKTGYVYWGEVGPDAKGDGPRGPRGYDEINQARKAGNFGWPYFIANNLPYADYDYATKKLGPLFDPQRPVNESVNNTGLRELPPAEPAFIYWPYGKPDKWTELGQGGRTACAGPVFHWQPEFAKSNGFPQHFDNCLLFWDWERPFIKWARMDKESNLVGLEPFPGAVVASRANTPLPAGTTRIKRPSFAIFGPDGQLYLMDYGETWGANGDSQLLKISYISGNLPPVPKVQPDFLAVSDAADGKATLSAAESRDPEGSALTFQWTLQPGGKPLGTTAEIPVTIKEPGNYVAEVRVTDAQGGSNTASARLIVGNRAPKVTFLEPKEGDTYTPGQPIQYRLAISDPEDGESSGMPDVFGGRTLVTGAFRRDDGKEEPLDPGITRMKQAGCFNCHAAEQKIVGPSLVEVATKYRGQAGAVELLTKKVREGGSGVWGPVPMLPHPQFTDDEVVIMLRWMLALEPGKGGPALLRGLTGEVATPKPPKRVSGGFVLEATYTDLGRAPAGELSGRATITLRPR